jgi:hypothetical protein
MLPSGSTSLRQQEVAIQTVYIETSVVSYLRHTPTASAPTVSRQLATRQWWDADRQSYSLVTSQYVHDESSAGDGVLAADRLKHLSGISLLTLDPQIDELADEILARAILPPSAALDALHIACAAVHRIDFLLTWNCKHIANPVILPRVFRVIDDFNLPFPVICTPQDMLDFSDEDAH